MYVHDIMVGISRSWLEQTDRHIHLLVFVFLLLVSSCVVVQKRNTGSKIGTTALVTVKATSSLFNSAVKVRHDPHGSKLRSSLSLPAMSFTIGIEHCCIT